MDELIDDVLTQGTDVTINDKENNIIYQFVSSDRKNNKNKTSNVSSINLGECGTILKEKYNIANNSLLILKSDAFLDNSLIPVVQYEVYHPKNKTKLNLDYCSDTKIDIKIPVLINEDHLYKYEPNSDYYNDRCFSTTSEKGTDVSIKDRKKEFVNNNLTLCENDCEYLGYDSETKESNCQCKVKKEMIIFNIKIDKDRLKDKFQVDKSTNIGIVKCYYLLFRKDGLKKNIGSYILLLIIFLFIIDLFVFFFKGYKSLLNKIKKVLKDKINLKDIKNLKTSGTKKDTNKSKKEKYKTKKDKTKKDKKKEKKKTNCPSKKTKTTKKNKDKYLNFKNNDELKSSNKNIIKENISNINLLTNNINNKNKKGKTEVKENKTKNVSIILKKKNKKKIEKKNERKEGIYNIKYNDFEINTLIYEVAIIYDKRTFSQYYLSLLKTKHILLFSFYTKDYNSVVIKISLLFFSFALYYTINALFYTDSTMHNIYTLQGKYDFIYQLPKIIYSNLISTVINCLLFFLSLPEKTIIEVKNKLNEKNYGQLLSELKKTLLFRLITYYILHFLFLLFFWFYVACFCVVYKNTQTYLIADTLISFSLSLIYPFGFYLLPGIFRIPALKDKKGSKNFLYTCSQLLQSI